MALEPSQAAREAAASMLSQDEWHPAFQTAQRIRKGLYDGHKWVQSFAAFEQSIRTQIFGR